MISLYEEMIYDEDVRLKQPELYSVSGISKNRSCEHFKTTNFKIMKSILEITDIPKEVLKGSNSIVLSVLWNLPRKEYNEKTQWVCVSGDYFCTKEKPFVARHFVVSDNTRSEENQRKAIEIIKLVNRCKNEW